LNNLKDAVKNSSCIIIVADHEIFKAIDPKEIGKLMKEKIIFDTKNCIDLEKWRKEGFRTILLGASY
jgi:UDP-N-acetyl-D-mannosaminuronic acid dehydrogenase